MRTKSKILDRSIRIEWPRNMSAWSHRTAKPWPSKRKSGFLWLSAVIIDEFMEIVNQKHKSRTKKCINRFLSFSTFLFFTSQYYISRSLYIIWNPISSKIQRMMSLFHEAYCLQEASREKMLSRRSAEKSFIKLDRLPFGAWKSLYKISEAYKINHRRESRIWILSYGL